MQQRRRNQRKEAGGGEEAERSVVAGTIYISVMGVILITLVLFTYWDKHFQYYFQMFL